MITETKRVTIKRLVPSEGMTLTDGAAYSKEVYLGKYDSPENWREITDEQAEKEQAEKEKAERERADADLS